MIAAAEKKAKEIGQPMNIAVADEGGNLVSHCLLYTSPPRQKRLGSSLPLNVLARILSLVLRPESYEGLRRASGLSASDRVG